jgi:hypothetical protein
MTSTIEILKIRLDQAKEFVNNLDIDVLNNLVRQERERRKTRINKL